jgi:hypothetical protein
MRRFPIHPMRRYLRCGHLGVLFLITLFFVPVMGYASDTSPGDAFKGYQVKAVFLYNLINFVTWPDSAFESADSPFKICILGKDPFGGLLEKVIQGERINGRRLVLERIPEINDLSFCHILFISSSMEKELPQIFTTTRNDAMLTVGDVEGFTQKGGIVNLIPKQGRISVEINTDSAKEAGVFISAKLLNLATIVKSLP